jgi:hypothetical protein
MNQIVVKEVKRMASMAESLYHQIDNVEVSIGAEAENEQSPARRATLESMYKNMMLIMQCAKNLNGEVESLHLDK